MRSISKKFLILNFAQNEREQDRNTATTKKSRRSILLRFYRLKSLETRYIAAENNSKCEYVHNKVKKLKISKKSTRKSQKMDFSRLEL